MGDDEEKRKELSQLLEKIVKTNKGEVDPELLKDLKGYCRLICFCNNYNRFVNTPITVSGNLFCL